jgi:hypothetical protein
MLTDAALRALKPKEKDYKVADRDGMYVHVTAKGAMSFRMDYRLNGRRERLYLGKYAPDGLFLARSREKCIDARRAVAQGISPAIEKQREKRRLKEAKSFGELGEKWLQAAPMADSTRAMRRSIFERELLPAWRNRLLWEISPDDLRAHCVGIVDRGAPATAIHVRDIVKQIYGFAILHGEKLRILPTRSAPRRSRPSFLRIDRYHRRRSASCSGSWRRCRHCRPSGSACASSCCGFGGSSNRSGSRRRVRHMVGFSGRGRISLFEA